MSRNEAEYKQEWLTKHHKADEILVDEKSKDLVTAIYYYPPTDHAAQMKKIWRVIGARMELERLEEMENE